MDHYQVVEESQICEVEVLNEEVAADLEDVAEVGEVLHGDWRVANYYVSVV